MKTEHFICGVIFFCLCSCSNGSTQTTRSDDNKISNLNNVTLATNTPMAQSPVKVLGYFTNVQSNGEHQWGYSVQIWRQSDRIYGLFSGSRNSMTVGDPPTGLLVDQTFDEETGKFSFRTITPSNTFHFDGVLTKKVLSGRLLNATTNETEKIFLKRSKELSSEMMEEYSSYEEWNEFADRILKFRGPKS